MNDVLSDILVVAGCVLVVIGLAAIWWPIGVIAAGLELMGMGWVFAVHAMKKG